MTLSTELDCQACGACCSYSSEWPRFSTESDADLDLLPAQFVSA
ncbi:MAG: YkgJ family cysteine cluster protein, partial [Rhizobium sp.]